MDNDSYRVSVVIPNYNRKADLERLLPSIASQTFADYEVIIIDDFSPDRSAVGYIKNFIENRKNMRLVENPENIGFVKTCNRGIKLAKGDYVCILTNDTEVKENFIQRNVETMDSDNSIGVLSCIVVDKEGNNWFSGGTLRSWMPGPLRDNFEGVRQVDYVAGTACFYRREVFEQVGLLNEYFVMYHEDVEFCLRVRTETDYKTCVFGEKLVVHHLGSSGLVGLQFWYYLHRNNILLLKRYSPKSIPRVLLCYIREAIRYLGISLLKLRPSYFLLTMCIIKATLDGLIQSQDRGVQSVDVKV